MDSSILEATTVVQEKVGMNLPDPIAMLLLIDDKLLKEEDTLHPWQVQHLVDFASSHISSRHPFKSVVRAANGSGKDKYIIAPEATWLCLAFPYTMCVVTSSSGTQLDRQTDTYIRQICEATNRHFGKEIWKCNYRYYECLETGSRIVLFVTDEAGRAEGWHPIVTNGKLAIFMSEAKSVLNEIDQAFDRAIGYTHRVYVSSPGLPMGHFYDTCQLAKKRKLISSTAEVNDWIEYHITAFDCPHIPQEHIDALKKKPGCGEATSFYKSSILADFGTTDEMVVIPFHHVWNAIYDVKIGHLKETYNIGGLDLSAGGDETVLSVRNGNKLLAVEGFKFSDTQLTIEHVEMLFRKHDLLHAENYVYADAGGLGKPIIDQLRGRGWKNIKYVLNQSTPRDERVFRNRGTEMWFGFDKFLESREIILLDDSLLKTQLSSRYYRSTEGSKYILESKLQARAKGHPSPDRADSVILCFSNYKSKLEEQQGPLNIPVRVDTKSPKITSEFTQQEYARRDLNKDKYQRVGNPNHDIYRLFVQRHNDELKQQEPKPELNYAS